MRAHSFLSFFTTHSVNNLLNAFKKKSLLSEAPPKVQPKLFLLQFIYKCYIIEPDLAILTYNDVFIVTLILNHHLPFTQIKTNEPHPAIAK